MTMFQAIILGLVEGTTEFLPISSTFHLIWSAKLLALPQSDFLKLFEVVIQSGAIIAVILVYRKTLVNLNLLKKIFISFVPTAVIGLLLYKIIKQVFFEEEILQLFVFGSVGILFIVFERVKEKHNFSKNIQNITLFQAFIIGIIQSFSVIPGVSRAGAVMLGLMIFGVKRQEAAYYSFLLAVPTIFAASILDIIKMRYLFGQSNDVLIFMMGIISAFISALFVINLFIRFLNQHKLSLFGWYRIIIAFIALSFFA